MSPQVVGFVTVGSRDDSTDEKTAYGPKFRSAGGAQIKIVWLVGCDADDRPSGHTNQKSYSGSLHKVSFPETYQHRYGVNRKGY